MGVESLPGCFAVADKADDRRYLGVLSKMESTRDDEESDSDEDVDILSFEDGDSRNGLMFGNTPSHHFGPNSYTFGHLGSLRPTGAAPISELNTLPSAQKDASESGSESDSSQSGSDSENESSEDAQEQRQQQPMLGQQIAPDERAIQASNKGQQQQQRFWEDCPEIYGIRRSGRARKEPERLTVAAEGSGSDVEGMASAQQRRKNARKKGVKQTSSSEDWSHQGSPGYSSDEYTPQARNRPRPMPRPNARLAPAPAAGMREPVMPRGRMALSSGREGLGSTVRQRLESEESSEDDDDDDDKERNSLRKSAKAIASYKEESEDETDSDDVVESNMALQGEYVEDDREAIEKILKHRTGRVGETGALTTIYAPDYELMQRRPEPEPSREPTELQYLIKWRGWSHLHNTWESERTLHEQNVKGMKKLDNYQKREAEIAAWKRLAAPEDVEYFEVQQEMNEDIFQENQEVERIIAHTMVKNYTETGDLVNQVDYLSKWYGLPYSESTWEDGGLISRFSQDKIDAYLIRERSDRIPAKSAKVLRQRPKFAAFKRQPEYLGRAAGMSLRDYQLGGLNWLVNAWCKGHSVILADEMGLGKTIQVISFLSCLHHTHSLFGPFLLVVPLSTIAAWQREFSVWAPDINLVVYLGDITSRSKIREHEFYHGGSKLKFNALLTTYEILLKDKNFLGNLHWTCLVVDEAHRLKNDDSLLYKCLQDFHTNHRLLVTGTPLQNSLKELWALLHFIMPHSFYSWEDFEQAHSTQDEKDKGFSSLHKVLEPFLLRRVKKDVEKSLPAKVEQILRVEMSSVQKQYYKWILTKNFSALNKGLKGNLNSFLNIVMELKKCCNHAFLIRPSDGQCSDLQQLIRGSGKLFLLDKLLCRLKDTGHRVLIFSQMVRMLDILADYLAMRRFQFQRLDGSIRGDTRKQALDHFNAEGSEDFCFLLSTRAGGLGINLATADTVIIFDSDWNPQNDLQAQARAHRIGQKNQVNIYRLVMKNSVEEDIIERAKRKMVLDHLIIQRMDTTGRKVLSKGPAAPSTNTPFNKEELASILKFGAEELFKEGEGEQDTRLQEMDIDDILCRAETRESDDQPQTIGEELLSQFKVASVAIDEDEEIVEAAPTEAKTWTDIIPQEVRDKAQEEEEQKKRLALYLPPRKRKSVKKMNYGQKGHSDSDGEERRKKRRGGGGSGKKKKSATDSELESDADGKDGVKRKRGRPRTIKREDVDGFNDSEIRRFVKSYKKFARPKTRLDSIARDAELEDFSMEDLCRLADILHDGCLRAVKEYDEKLNEDPNFDGKKRGATLRLSNVTVNAPSVLKHEEELEPLACCIPGARADRLKYRLTVPAKSVHWGVMWDVPDDSMLLAGIYEYGMGSWEAIKADPSLGLANKILPPGNMKPQEKHLQTRAEYLVKLLHQESIVTKADELRKSSQKLKTKIRKLKQKESRKKASVDAVSPACVPVPSPMEAVAVPSPVPVETKESCDAAAEKPKPSQEIAKEKKKKSAAKSKAEPGPGPKKEKKEKKKAAKEVIKAPRELEETPAEPEEPLSPPDEPADPAAGSGSMGDMDKEVFDSCKEKMRPVKRALKMLESPEGSMAEKEQVQQTRQCLLKIGDHIMDITSQYKEVDLAKEWRGNLWSFVSKFTAFEAKKLFKLYKHAAKKRDETKQQERSVKHATATAPKPDTTGAPAQKRPEHWTGARPSDVKRPTESAPHGAPLPKIPRIDGSGRPHPAGTSSGGRSHTGRDNEPRKSHSDRQGIAGKDRPRDSHDYRDKDRDRDRDRERYHDSHRERDKSSDHYRAYDAHPRPHDRNSEHYARAYDKGHRRDDHRRSDSREHSSERRYHSHHRVSNDGSSRHSGGATSPSDGSRTSHESKRDKKYYEHDRDKR